MTREEKCKLAIDRGYTYNKETGEIIGIKGKPITKTTSNGYIQIPIREGKKQHQLYGHQFVWYYINNECVNQIDHKNGIRNDNRIDNLRSVTQQENNWNQINAKGYYWNERDKGFQVQIGINGKNTYIGFFKTEEEAINAREIAKNKHHKINENK